MKWNEAIGLLEECEQGLRGLVGEAAAEGEYGDVVRIDAKRPKWSGLHALFEHVSEFIP